MAVILVTFGFTLFLVHKLFVASSAKNYHCLPNSIFLSDKYESIHF